MGGEANTKSFRPAGPLDPVAAAVAQAFSAAPLSAFPITVTRAAMRDACAPTGQPAMHAVRNVQVPTGDGHEMLVRLYQPVSDPAALVLWAHGGGFALGSVDEIDNFARLLAECSGCAVASVEYRLAPEHRFPVPLHDVEAAIAWLDAQRDALGLAGLPLWVGGDSAGANLATVATRRLHEVGSVKVSGNVLAYPCTDSPDTPSLRDFDPPFMSADDVAWFIDHYLPDRDAWTNPDFAPIRAGNLSVLPRTLVVTAEHDILTAQAEDYARVLVRNGVPVETYRQSGMIHGFLTLDAFLPGAAREAIGRIAAFVKDGAATCAP